MLKYPKFTFLIITYALAYAIFRGAQVRPAYDFLVSSGYFGTFFAGMGYSFGFTAAPAIAILLLLGKHQVFLLAVLIAGFGSLASDILIFRFVRHSFGDEIKTLSREKIIMKIRNVIPAGAKRWLSPIIGFFIIASPLPDEIGVSLIASIGSIKQRTFILLSYVLNTAGIFLILRFGMI